MVGFVVVVFVVVVVRSAHSCVVLWPTSISLSAIPSVKLLMSTANFIFFRGEMWLWAEYTLQFLINSSGVIAYFSTVLLAGTRPLDFTLCNSVDLSDASLFFNQYFLLRS